ncbi:unnamed protein product [Prorocentrum cordatum]|uniref:Exocyst complex component Sec6 n=1 Tax=Prorocentrum cordatum TaxID=2364126 RepID=A0ABN9XL24_9DINO|nr:unnamed protein product [Polarella glacialis]
MSDDRRSNQQSPQQPAGGAAVSVAGDDIGLSVDLAELMQTDPVKAKWQLQVHKVSHSLALTGSKALGRQRNTLRLYATEADQMGRSEGDSMREHADLNQEIEKLISENAWFTMARPALDELLFKLKEKGIDFPTKAKNDCAARAIADWSQNTTESLETRVASLLDMVQAWPKPGEEATFDPLQPRVRHMDGSPKDLMATMMDTVLKKVIIPLLKDGASSFDCLLRVIRNIITMISQASDEENLDFEPYEESGDTMLSMLRGIAVVIQPDIEQQRELQATNKDFDKLQAASANLQPGELSVIATMKQNGHYKTLLAEYMRCKPHYDDIMPRLAESQKQLTELEITRGFQDNSLIVLNAWKTKLGAENKIRSAQLKSMSDCLETSTMAVLTDALDSVKKNTLPQNMAANLRELLTTCKDAKFDIPFADELNAFVEAASKRQTVDSHTTSFCDAMGSFSFTAPRDARQGAVSSLVGMAKTYIDFGVTTKNQRVEDAIYAFLGNTMLHMGKGEDYNLVEGTCSFMMSQCQLCSILLDVVGEVRHDMVATKTALNTLSGLQWDFTNVYNYMKLGDDAEKRIMADKSSVALKRFVAAKEAMLQAKGDIFPAFFERWCDEVNDMAAQAKELDCTAHVDKFANAAAKLAREFVWGCASGKWHDGLSTDDPSKLPDYHERAKTSLYPNCSPSKAKTEIDSLNHRMEAATSAMKMHLDVDEGRAEKMARAVGVLNRLGISYCEGMLLICLRDFADQPLKLKRNVKSHMSFLPKPLHGELPLPLSTKVEEVTQGKK